MDPNNKLFHSTTVEAVNGKLYYLIGHFILRSYCVTSRKVTVSIPDYINGIFH
jgi:hypothetical protein